MSWGWSSLIFNQNEAHSSLFGSLLYTTLLMLFHVMLSKKFLFFHLSLDSSLRFLIFRGILSLRFLIKVFLIKKTCRGMLSNLKILVLIRMTTKIVPQLEEVGYSGYQYPGTLLYARCHQHILYKNLWDSILRNKFLNKQS